MEKEKVTRRKFLEDSSKKALAGSAAAFLGLGMIKPKPMQAAGCALGWCTFGCSASCGACTGSCEDTCSGSCTGDCSSGCTDNCKEACNDSGRSVSAAEATCGTLVSEREVSPRHVTV